MSGYVAVSHAQGYVLMVMFMLQVVSGISLLMCYRVCEDEYGYLCLLISNVLFNWTVSTIHSLGVNAIFFFFFFHVVKGMFYSGYAASREFS